MAAGEIHVPLWVDYADDDKIIDAGEKAELLLIRGLCFMKRNKTDGFISNRQLQRIPLPGIQARAHRLVAVGLWEQVTDGYYCPSFLKRNKSRAEIEVTSGHRTAAALAANHRRWHSETPSDSCPLCDLISDPKSDPSSESSSQSQVKSESKTRAHLCPQPFEVDDELRVWGKSNTPGVDLDDLAATMVIWSRSKGKKHLDWRMTLQGWARDHQKELAAKPSKIGFDPDALSRSGNR